MNTSSTCGEYTPIELVKCSLILFRRSATLRDVANLLYSRNTKLSSPTALHSFRIVYNNRGRFGARDVGSGVTRVSMASLDAATVDVFDKHEDEGLPSLFIRTLKEARPERPRDVDEMASRQTLEDIGLRNGDILDCAIKQSRSDRDVVGERPRRMDIAERDRRPSTRRQSLSPNRGTRVSRPLR